MARFDVIMVIS